MNSPRTVAILIFDEVEVLDFAGPFEVFSVAGRSEGAEPFRVLTVGPTGSTVRTRGGLAVTPHHSLDDCPDSDLLLVPGGFGVRALLEDRRVLDWIAHRAAQAELVLSVCTGSLLLAAAGLLEGLEATTHHLSLDRLEQLAPSTRVHRDRRLVDTGRLVTSAGVAAGIDMSFHVLARLLGEESARATARYIEYPWPPASSREVPGS